MRRRKFAVRALPLVLFIAVASEAFACSLRPRNEVEAEIRSAIDTARLLEESYADEAERAVAEGNYELVSKYTLEARWQKHHRETAEKRLERLLATPERPRATPYADGSQFQATVRRLLPPREPGAPAYTEQEVRAAVAEAAREEAAASRLSSRCP